MSDTAVLSSGFLARLTNTKWMWPANIALVVSLTAILLGGSAAVLQATPPPSDKSASSGKVQAKNVPPHSPRPDASAAAPYLAVLNQYCLTCHNEQLHTAGLVLSKLDPANVSEGAAVWEKVVEKLRAEAMPPAGMPRPDKATYDAFATYLETSLDRAAAAKPNPGRVAVHRLNRSEYTNAIRDLLATDIDVESLLPVDDSGYGFDNIADVLAVSPMLLERYMSAARKVVRLAAGDSTVLPNVTTFELSPWLSQDDRMSEDLPFGSRGGTAIRYDFPVDGTYVVKVRLERNSPNYDEHIIGLYEPQQLEIRLNDAKLKAFTIGGEFSKAQPAKAQSAEQESLQDDVNTAVKGREGNPAEKYRRAADEGLEVRFPAKAGPGLLQVYFLGETAESEGPLHSHTVGSRYLAKDVTGLAKNRSNEDIAPYVGKVILEGPYDAKGLEETPSRRKIFVCHPANSAGELPCATKILSGLARRAYRRPVTGGDVQDLLSLYKAGRDKGDFEAGMKMALQGMLVSPEFLFRIEHDPATVAPGTAYRTSDLELASRLSFFLWSSIPDDELLGLASAGKLKDPAVLEQQVRRMLADSRSKALVTNFAGQWLYLRNLPRVAPGPTEFPEFDENLRVAFEQETELFLESNLREDRSVLNLLDASYTFLNERLARFYGIPNVYGSQFRRVSLVGHDERMGLLGQGSVLTVTSYANRTSPTVRGKWVLGNILGTPPPPPPPNVPSLKEIDRSGQVVTMRKRMEQHRANPACAVCHVRTDPLGFALENFDGIGKWRVQEGDTLIDASGVLPDGTKFDGPAELRKVLLTHPDQFATTVTEKLLTYGLGRGVEYYDAPAIRKITREAASSDYRWSSLILGIVKSVPFQMRMSKPQDPGTVKTTISQNQAVRESKP